MFALLFHHFSRRVTRYFSQNRAAKITTASLFILLLLFLSAGIFSFFLHGFRFLSLSGYFKDAILLYLSELFMLTIFVLMFVSALIIGLFSLFSGKDTQLLALSPRYSLMPLFILARMFLTSLWPMCILFFPALLALSFSYSLSFPGALLVILAISLLVALAVASALSLIFLIATTLSFLKKTVLTQNTLIFFTLIVSTLFIYAAWHNTRSVSLNTLFAVETIESTAADISSIKSHFALLPSHPMALAFFAASHNDTKLLVRSILMLTSFLGVACIPFLLLRKYHLALWQHFQETASSHRSYSHFKITPLSRASGPLDALLRKEIITFFRNTKGMTWFGFFCLIWLLQSGSTFILNHQLSERPTTIPYIVITLQIAAAIYFVNMFVLRFAFPSFSIEQKMRWVIESAPLNATHVFLARIGFYIPLLVLLGLLFSLLNTFTTTLTSSQHLFVLGTICLVSATVTLYGLALGALFPNFETDDPEVLSTSLPGLTFIFTSVLYGGFAAAAMRYSLVSGEYALLMLFLFSSALIILVSLSIPLRRFQK